MSQEAILKAILFDCDGVLAETEGDGHRVAFNNTFRDFGVDAYWDMEEYGRLLKVGGGKERMTHFFRSDQLKYPPERFDDEFIVKLHKAKTESFAEMCVGIQGRPGVRRIMEDAAKEGISIFVCSTSNEKSVANIANSVLQGEEKRIITKIYAGDVVSAKKPAPDIYLLALKEYGLDPKSCLVIEDTRIGMQAAIAAGINCFITRSFYNMDEDFDGAVAVVDCFGDKDTPCNPVFGVPASTQYITLDILRRSADRKGLGIRD